MRGRVQNGFCDAKFVGWQYQMQYLSADFSISKPIRLNFLCPRNFCGCVCVCICACKFVNARPSLMSISQKNLVLNYNILSNKQEKILRKVCSMLACMLAAPYLTITFQKMKLLNLKNTIFKTVLLVLTQKVASDGFYQRISKGLQLVESCVL